MDYENYEFALFLGQTEEEATKRMCHMKKETAIYGQFVSIRMQRFMILKIKRELPEVIRLIIISMLVDLYRTSPAPFQKVPRGILNSIKREFDYSAFSWGNLHVSENSIYYPLCRGYCYNCGEPQGARFGKRDKFDKIGRIVLNKYRLTIMVLCYCCLADGFSFDPFNNDYHTVIVPRAICRRKIKI